MAWIAPSRDAAPPAESRDAIVRLMLEQTHQFGPQPSTLDTTGPRSLHPASSFLLPGLKINIWSDMQSSEVCLCTGLGVRSRKQRLGIRTGRVLGWKRTNLELELGDGLIHSYA